MFTKPKVVGILNVHVIEAKELPGLDVGGKSDPYVQIKLGKHDHKTKTIMKTVTPIWNEKFDLEINNMNDTIEFFVYDWDKLSFNDLIGKVSYTLSSLKNGKNDLWLQLPQKNNKIPQLHIVLQIQPKILVTVIAAKDLVAADIGGKSDPFCEVVLQNKKFKTNVIKKTVNPTWNETFEFEIHDINAIVYFNIFDWDLLSKSDSLGAAVVSLTSLKLGENDLWLDLPKKGSVHVNIQAQGFGSEITQQNNNQQQNYNQNQQQNFNQNQQQNFNQNQQQNNYQQGNYQQQGNNQQGNNNQNQQGNYNQNQQGNYNQDNNQQGNYNQNYNQQGNNQNQQSYNNNSNQSYNNNSYN